MLIIPIEDYRGFVIMKFIRNETGGGDHPIYIAQKQFNTETILYLNNKGCLYNYMCKECNHKDIDDLEDSLSKYFVNTVNLGLPRTEKVVVD